MTKKDENSPSQETMDTAARWYYSEMMSQLMESERFCNWFQLNFDVHKLVDEKEKRIEIRVMEVPPELVQSRMQEQLLAAIKDKKQHSIDIVPAGAMNDLKKA